MGDETNDLNEVKWIISDVEKGVADIEKYTPERIAKINLDDVKDHDVFDLKHYRNMLDLYLKETCDALVKINYYMAHGENTEWEDVFKSLAELQIRIDKDITALQEEIDIVSYTPPVDKNYYH